MTMVSERKPRGRLAALIRSECKVVRRNGMVVMIYFPEKVQAVPVKGGGWVVRRYGGDLPDSERYAIATDTLPDAVREAHHWIFRIRKGDELDERLARMMETGERVIPVVGNSRWEDEAAYWRQRAIRAENAGPPQPEPEQGVAGGE